MQDLDFLVIGAGMAGLSVAAELAREASVAVLEQEPQSGYHATGRSAALYSALYGNATIRCLTRASRAFLFNPPPGFCEHPLAMPRETMFFARRGEADALAAFALSLPDARPRHLTEAQARERVPLFQPGYLDGALLEAGSADLDVAALLQGYAQQCRQRGALLQLDSPLIALEREGTGWRAHTRSGPLRARAVVNAAGAWGDEVARLAGVAPVGLLPKRRTALLVEVPGGLQAQAWPAAIHVGETFYFKPDAGLLLVSPADETPSPACDAQPEEYDVAVAVDQFEQASGAPVRQLRARWAGLRTFTADKTPVVGYAPDAPGFFWLVGQGGYGIQTAPALARAAAALALGQPLPQDLAHAGLQPADLAPNRPGLQG